MNYDDTSNYVPLFLCRLAFCCCWIIFKTKTKQKRFASLFSLRTRILLKINGRGLYLILFYLK